MVKTWKVLIATDVFKADGTILVCPVDTIIDRKQGVFSINDEVIRINKNQIDGNPTYFEAQPLSYVFDEVNQSTPVNKVVHIKFLSTLPVLTADQKNRLGVLAETFMNNL